MVAVTVWWRCGDGVVTMFRWMIDEVLSGGLVRDTWRWGLLCLVGKLVVFYDWAGCDGGFLLFSWLLSPNFWVSSTKESSTRFNINDLEDDLVIWSWHLWYTEIVRRPSKVTFQVVFSLTSEDLRCRLFPGCADGPTVRLNVTRIFGVNLSIQIPHLGKHHRRRE